MDEKLRQAFFDSVEKEPFARKFGMHLVRIEEGYSEVRMTVTPDMGNMLGVTHGGAVFALMDEAFQTASNSHGTLAMALNMSVTYVASPAQGATLTAQAREFSRTHRTANYDIKVRDEDGRLMASCQALVYRKGTPLPFLAAAN